MSARANAQIDSKRPMDASSLSDEGIGEGARLKGGSPWRSLEIDTLRWRWQAAVSDSHTLPPFEELALDGLGGLLVGVEGKVDGRVKAQGAEVVHAQDVVGVAVGVEDGVEAAEALAHRLGVEVWAGVDDDVVALPGDKDRGTGAAVMRIGRRKMRLRRRRRDADIAHASQRGDAH